MEDPPEAAWGLSEFYRSGAELHQSPHLFFLGAIDWADIEMEPILQRLSLWDLYEQHGGRELMCADSLRRWLPRTDLNHPSLAINHLKAQHRAPKHGQSFRVATIDCQFGEPARHSTTVAQLEPDCAAISLGARARSISGATQRVSYVHLGHETAVLAGQFFSFAAASNIEKTRVSGSDREIPTNFLVGPILAADCHTPLDRMSAWNSHSQTRSLATFAACNSPRCHHLAHCWPPALCRRPTSTLLALITLQQSAGLTVVPNQPAAPPGTSSGTSSEGDDRDTDPNDGRCATNKDLDEWSGFFRGGPSRLGRPEIVVVVDAREETLAANGGASVVDWGLPVEVPPKALEDLYKRADAHPVIVANGVVLYAPGEMNLGRSTRLASRAQRRALRALYPTCAVPDCCVAFEFTKPHHVHYWEHGGPTDLDNLLPLCSKHHHAAHEGGWSLTLQPNRTLTITLPDSTILTTGPPVRLRAA